MEKGKNKKSTKNGEMKEKLSKNSSDPAKNHNGSNDSSTLKPPKRSPELHYEYCIRLISRLKLKYSLENVDYSFEGMGNEENESVSVMAEKSAKLKDEPKSETNEEPTESPNSQELDNISVESSEAETKPRIGGGSPSVLAKINAHISRFLLAELAEDTSLDILEGETVSFTKPRPSSVEDSDSEPYEMTDIDKVRKGMIKTRIPVSVQKLKESAEKEKERKRQREKRKQAKKDETNGKEKEVPEIHAPGDEKDKN